MLGHHVITLKNKEKESSFDLAFIRQAVFEGNQKVDERNLLITKKSQLINAKGMQKEKISILIHEGDSGIKQGLSVVGTAFMS